MNMKNASVFILLTPYITRLAPCVLPLSNIIYRHRLEEFVFEQGGNAFHYGATYLEFHGQVGVLMCDVDARADDKVNLVVF